MHKMRKKRKVVLFLHIPKTAGKTLGEILKSQYPARVVRFDGTPKHRWYKGKTALYLRRQCNQGKRCIYGHYNFAMNLHEKLSRPFCYITMLRDPVDRVISLYFYIRRSPGHYLHTRVRNMSLAQFASAQDIHENSNSQTILLAGSNNAELAKQNLARYFSVVGLTEHFNESLFLMKRELGWRNLRRYVSYHVSKRRPSVREVSPQVIQIIQNNNRSDIEVYEFAKHLFQQKLNSLEPEARNQLQVFLGQIKP
ncbi:sulfotransferase family 2 domain-containing protein [Brevibacillus sp. SYSU BS000544]